MEDLNKAFLVAPKKLFDFMILSTLIVDNIQMCPKF